MAHIVDVNLRYIEGVRDNVPRWRSSVSGFPVRQDATGQSASLP